MRAWLCVLALAGCDRVFGIGDPYEDATTQPGSDAAMRIDGSIDAPAGTTGPPLLARFPFDNSYQDAAGSDSALHDGCAKFDTSGQFMQSVTLDGTCCISFQLTPPLGAYSISFWAKAQTSDSTQLPLLVFPNYTGSPSDDWALTGGSTQALFYVETSTGTSNLGTGVVDTSWRQYAVTFDGHTFQAFDNGSPSASFTLGAASTVLYGAGTTVWIGCDSTTSSSKFAGNFDEVQIYGAALTAQQVAMLHQAATLP